MKIPSPLTRVAAIGAGAVLLAAAVVLVEWLAGLSFFTRPDEHFVPMAPSTAMLFLLLGGTILFHARRDAGTAVGPIVNLAPALALLVASLLLAQFLARIFFGSESDLERIIAPTPGSIGRVLLDRMAPITALLFILQAGHLLLFSTRRYRHFGEMLGGGVAAVASVLVIGYVYGEPLLYGGRVIPVAFSTAVLFLLSAVALFAADAESWLVRLATGDSVRIRIYRGVVPPTMLLVLFNGWLDIHVVDMIHTQYYVLLNIITSLCIALIIAAIVSLVARSVDSRVKTAEKALRASEVEFRSLAEAMPQIVWSTRADGWNTYFNQQWVDYTGLTQEESRGSGWNTPFHPDDQRRALAAWQQATQNNGIYSLESRLRRADGAYRWWLVRGVPMRAADGEIIKWFGTCTDIEEIKQAEAALRESESKFRNYVELSPDGIFIVDNAGRLKDANDAACRITGYSKEELFAMGIEDLLAEESLEDGLAVFQELLKTNKATFDPWLQCKDGSKICMTVDAVRLSETRLVGFCKDITERKRTEEHLRRQDEELHARNEELTRFNREMSGRELRMIELKQEVNDLAAKLGQPRPYALAFMESPALTNPKEKTQ
jgi:PAS domain S-box-containing protein